MQKVKKDLNMVLLTRPDPCFVLGVSTETHIHIHSCSICKYKHGDTSEIYLNV